MFIGRHFVAFIVVAFTLAAPVVPSAAILAQSIGGTTNALRCEFTVLATGTWSEGEARAEIGPSRLSLAFEAIDVGDGVATTVGGFGPASIVVRLTAGNLHLMQVGRNGTLYVTTVFSRATRDGKLQAVHTRHEYTEVSLPGFTSRPEQYYGECKVESGPAV